MGRTLLGLIALGVAAMMLYNNFSKEPEKGSPPSAAAPGAASHPPTAFEKLDDPAYAINEDIALQGMEVARAKWEGRNIEFKFWPREYNRTGETYRFFGADTAFTCDLPLADFERITLRRTGVWIVVRGTVGALRLDQNVPIQNCEVVSIDASAWSAD